MRRSSKDQPNGRDSNSHQSRRALELCCALSSERHPEGDYIQESPSYPNQRFERGGLAAAKIARAACSGDISSFSRASRPGRLGRRRRIELRGGRGMALAGLAARRLNETANDQNMTITITQQMIADCTGELWRTGNPVDDAIYAALREGGSRQDHQLSRRTSRARER